MTTTQKIIFTPAAQQETTASASQNRELKLNSDIIMENIAAWDETPEGKAFREANDIRKPSKPADAHAAGEHTPITGDTERLLQIGQLTRERDQAREQVKTLLKACKLSMAFIADISFIDYPNATPAWDALKAAIASTESEEAK